MLPADIGEGDYIEFGLTGAYGSALATKFNGFGEYVEAQVADAPMTSVFEAQKPKRRSAKVIAIGQKL